MKKLILISAIFFSINLALAQNSPTLVPVGNDGKAQTAITTLTTSQGKDGPDFNQRYNQQASSLAGDLGTQMRTGIMNWDTPLNYLAYLVRMIMNIAMVIGGLMIIYAGYIYASGVFSGNVTKAPKAIRSAIIGILVITFSYLIIRILTAMFIS